MVTVLDSGAMKEINNVSSGSDKCDAVLNPENCVRIVNSHLGLNNSSGNVINCEKQKGLNLDLNEVENESNSNDTFSMPVDGKVLGVQNEVRESADADVDTTVSKRKRGRPPKETNRESNAEKVRVDAGDDANIETVVGTSGLRIGFGGLNLDLNGVDNEKNESNSNDTFSMPVDGKVLGVQNEVRESVDADVDTTVSKRKRGRPPKETKGESNAEKVRVDAGDDANIETVVGTSGLRIGFGKLPMNKGKSTSTSNKKVDVNAEPDIDTTVSKKKRGRPPKEIEFEDNVEEKVRVSASYHADIETFVGPSGKNRGKATGTFSKKVDVNADADMETTVSKRKRGRPPKEKGVDSTVEKIQVHVTFKKGGDADNAGDEYDNSEDSEYGEEAAVSAREDRRNDKEERRGRKRKMMKSSVHELDNVAQKKKEIGTQRDGECEATCRVLRSRAVLMRDDEKEEKNDASSNIIINEKNKEKSAHLSARKDKRLKGLQKSTRKIIKGSEFGDMAEQQKKYTSAVKGKKKGIKKQLLKERIKDMLIKAGWRIDFRPRKGKENTFDKVYVSSKGKGYWSVTLAYTILKEEIESGKADSRARKAYFPIAEDDWKSLLRTTKKKRGLEKRSEKYEEVKDQPKVISRITNLRKKHQLRLKQKAAVKKSCKKEKKSKKKFTLLARGSKKGSNSEGESFLLYEGQRSLLSWMIDLETVSLGAKVKCMNNRKTKVLLEGQVTKDGIQCDCCSEIFALADFESHSGSLLGLPFQSICLDSKISLLRCLRDSWIKYAESATLGFHSVCVDGDDPNDDTCNMCGDGGDLICCDSCPSAIHQKCLNIQKFPSGDWNCVYCCCKFCGIVGESTLDEDHDSVKSLPALPTCHMCEEKYHPLCARATSDKEPNSIEFCSQKCREIFHQLEELLGVRHQMEEGFSWTLVQHTDDNLDISSLIGAKNVECNAKLAVAWSVMDECFLPIVDQRSGINMIRNVVYSCGSNIRRLNYTGFFIAILERGDEIISVASLRIHGNLLAEMPFIGTRYTYRRQGMCRRLLNAIETALSSLNIEKLVLPAIPQLKQTWTSVFGFMPVEDSLKKEMKCMNMMAFPGIDMLQKPVTKRLTDLTSNKTADVATVDNASSQAPNASSNEPSDTTCKSVNCQDSLISDDKDRKEDGISPSEDASDENGKNKDIPSANCEMKATHLADCGTSTQSLVLV